MSLPFDHIFITSGEDIEGWHRMTGVRPTWLPWGTDSLTLGSGSGSRAWDLTRVGRQPPDWEDDTETMAAASMRNVRFRPRPSGLEKTGLNHTILSEAYASTKFMLAFSNRVNPMPYTHPTREYITGRWVDALGGGAVVAGCAPRGDCIDGLLWKGATLELESIDRQAGLEIISEALLRWTPDTARLNYAQALVRLDWRHRFQTIAACLGLTSDKLAADLVRLRYRLSEVLGGDDLAPSSYLTPS